MIDWPSYNRSLVRRGDILFSYNFLDTWGSELEKINKNKKGKPFVLPDSLILVIAYIRISFHLPYRQTEGIIIATGKHLLPANPQGYGHICIRINNLNIDIKRDKIGDGDDLIIATSSTNIKLTKSIIVFTYPHFSYLLPPLFFYLFVSKVPLRHLFY